MITHNSLTFEGGTQITPVGVEGSKPPDQVNGSMETLSARELVIFTSIPDSSGNGRSLEVSWIPSAFPIKRASDSS